MNRTYDAILVLGLKLIGGSKPEEELVLRVRKAAECYFSGLSEQIIVCGGRAKDFEKTEAEVMEALLIEMGVSKAAIRREDESKITYENIENAKKLLSDKREIALVTSDYHMRRSALVCRMLGLKPVCFASATPDGPEKRAKKRLEFFITLDTLFGFQRPNKKRSAVYTFLGRLVSARSYKTLNRDFPDALKKEARKRGRPDKTT